jgi:hypothetical protein
MTLYTRQRHLPGSSDDANEEKRTTWILKKFEFRRLRTVGDLGRPVFASRFTKPTGLQATELSKMRINYVYTRWKSFSLLRLQRTSYWVRVS